MTINASFPDLAGYSLNELIYQGEKSHVYRGIRLADQLPVVVKFLRGDHPDFDELLDFRHQYTLLQGLEIAGVVHPLALEAHQEKLALVMEDAQLVDMQAYLSGKPLSLEVFFHLALQIISIIGAVHQHGIIHKDIKPANILIHPKSKKIYLIDFSISSRLSKETQDITSPSILSGTLAYLSPEQTGRMNRGIDYRSDFYSLGVTFYQMLTGELPFYSSDPLEIVHSHLAQSPEAPQYKNAQIPSILNDLVLKLLEKNAEDRYQSAQGIVDDLQQAQQYWKSGGEIPDFVLGRSDLARNFPIPEKLYGRSKEVNSLLDAFERVSTGRMELVLVTGLSGIGKTALVNEVHKPIARERGYFCKGKFDPLRRDIPFSALAQALRMLVHLLLGEPADQLAEWKARILSAIGAQGRVLTDLIPELEDLIGVQAELPVLQGPSSLHRFQHVFRSFIQVFSKKEQPLVLFLDDLQWIDSASLQLLPLLLAPENNHYLLLIGAYRSNEVEAGHPLLMTIANLRQTELVIQHIEVKPLGKEHLQQLVADSCHCTLAQAHPLSDKIWEKTAGNPFFCHRFLRLLYEEGIIYFNPELGYWDYDLAKTEQLAASEDVVHFIATQIKKLSANSQDILQQAACLGNPFALSTLALIVERSMGQCAQDCWDAVQAALIHPLDDHYRFYHGAQSIEVLPAVEVRYRFVHDRVQQAAYDLIPESRKAQTHLRIGKVLKSRYAAGQSNELLFDLANQLNAGVSLITDLNERHALAEWNYKAGLQARISTAYDIALDYFRASMGLLLPDHWQADYSLSLALYDAAVETAYLANQLQQMEQWASEALAHCHSPLDQAKIHTNQCLSLYGQSRLEETVTYGLAILAPFSLGLSRHPDAAEVAAAFAKTKAMLANRPIASLLDLPTMHDPEVLAITQLLDALLSAFHALPELFALATCKGLELVLEHGNGPAAIIIYGNYGQILISNLGEVEQGGKFGQLCLDLVRKMQRRDLESRANIVVNGVIRPWSMPLRETLSSSEAAYCSGLETGDHRCASISALAFCMHAFACGLELSALEKKIALYCSCVQAIRQQVMLNWTRLFHQVVLNLLTTKQDICLLEGEAYRESKNVPIHLQQQDHFCLCLLYLHKLLFCLLFQQKDRAIEMAALAKSHLGAVMGTINFALFHFYSSLAYLAVYAERPPGQQAELLKKVKQNQQQMRHWANHAAMNFEHKWALVEAERCRVQGDILAAEDFYDEAIAGAKANQYQQEEAFANEYAARFYLARNKETIAQAYLSKAYYGYAHWGAKAKTDDLAQRYAVLLGAILQKTENTSPKSSTSGTKTIRLLDLGSVLKSSQTLSSELTLARLLEKILHIVMENAGARRVVLILSEQERWRIAGEYRMDQQVVELFPNTALEEYLDLPKSLLAAVIRKARPVVLDNVADPYQRFYQDSYFKTHPQLKSLLCQPVLSKGKLIALLYLENELVSAAFHPDRLQMMQMLAAQAAISIENALLYETLEDKVSERTRALKAVQAQLIQQAREAGMAEMAIGVMHNIGNALSTIKVPVHISLEKLRKSRLRTHLAATLQPLPEIVAQSTQIQGAEQTRLAKIVKILPQAIEEEYNETISQLERMSERIHHIENIIHLQQKYTRVKPMNEWLEVQALHQDALKILEELLIKMEVTVATDFPSLPLVFAEKHQLLQILLNLIKNACEAMEQTPSSARRLCLSARLEPLAQKSSDAEQKSLLILEVSDSGCGFVPSDKERLFSFGYSNKKRGSGFGLHASANSLIAQNGRIEACSKGPGEGAQFFVYLPVVVKEMGFSGL